MIRVLFIIFSVIVVIYMIGYTILHILNKKQNDDISRLKKIDNRHDILERMTVYINELATKNGINIIPAYGTLLGLVRDNKILDHDYDTDFFLFESDWNILKSILEKENRYKLEIINILWHKKMILKDKSSICMDLSIIKNNKNSIDLNVFLAFDRSSPSTGTFLWKTPTRVKFDKKWFLPLRKKSSAYGDFYFPNNIDAILTYWYDDWKTPVIY
jgi:hypothetical protein